MGKSTAAYIINNQKLLLILRDDIATIKDPNTWDTPGGYCEEGENFEECLKREIKEELDLEVRSPKYLGTRLTPKGNTEATFIVDFSSDELSRIKLGEGQRFQLFSYEELHEIPLTCHLTNVFGNYKDEIRKMLQGERANLNLGLNP